MLFKNDIFEFEGVQHRLIHTEPSSDKAWAIAVTDEYAWPREFHWSAISGLEALNLPARDISEGLLTKAVKSARDTAMTALAPLLEDLLPLFEASSRYRAVKAHTKRCKKSVPSLYKWLRMYWQNGQTPMALLPKFGGCQRRPESAGNWPI